MRVPWPLGILEGSCQGNKSSRQKSLLRPAKVTVGSVARQQKKPGHPMNQSGSTITRKWLRTLGHPPTVSSCHQEDHSFFILRHTPRARRCPGSCEGVVQGIVHGPVLTVMLSSRGHVPEPRLTHAHCSTRSHSHGIVHRLSDIFVAAQERRSEMPELCYID